MNKPIVNNISHAQKNLTAYATKIATAWHKATESILEVGRILLDAKEKLPPKEFRELKRGLTDAKIMSPSTLSKLQKIAGNAVLTKPDYQELLPPSYETLYKLSAQDNVVLEQKINDGEISNQTQRNDVAIIFDVQSSDTKNKSPKKQYIVSVKGDLSKITDDQLPELKDILSKLKEFGFEISGIELDQ